MSHTPLAYAASRARIAELHRARASERETAQLRPGRPRLRAVAMFMRVVDGGAPGATACEPSLALAASPGPRS